MARERDFDEDEVLAAATEAFTRHGYSATSLSMLLDATGLGKQSLYNAFGDKRSLYLKAVDVAVARFAKVADAMAAARTGRVALETFFHHLLEDCASEDDAVRFCIVSGGLLEGVDDPAVRATLLSRFGATRELLREAVERAQRDGSIACVAPSAEVADALMGVMGGLRIAVRAGLPPPRLRAMAALQLSFLDSP
ncbi:MAG: TetR/AcrR family transcriptional regulator [Myxococcaceae bacterium]|jgi:TetR/AcrR family transcriptional repressor of nem operon|nr:TetR/AcrR family transcriptional regulator [Myxococcaceae bacterium]